MRISDLVAESEDITNGMIDDVLISFIASGKSKISVTKLSSYMSNNGIQLDIDTLKSLLDRNDKIDSVSGDVATVRTDTTDSDPIDSEEKVSQIAQNAV